MNRVEALRILAIVAFGFAAVLPQLPSALTSLAGVGLLLGSFSARAGSATSFWTVVIGIASGSLVSLGLARGATDFPDAPSAVSAVWFAVVLFVGVISVVARRLRWAMLPVLVVLIGFLSIGTMWQYRSDPVGFDVFQSHGAAADALRNGVSPYGPAVDVADGSPTAAPGARIVGYAYPPPTLFIYAGSDLVAADSRWASAASLLVVAALAFKSRSAAAMFALLGFASIPLLRAMVWSGWTEPASLALVGMAMVTWPSVAGPVILGLALATKQYFIVLGPLLVVALRDRLGRLMTAFVVAAGAVGIAFIWDAGGAFDALIARPLEIGARPDSLSLSSALSGFGIDASSPGIVAVSIAATLGLVVARRCEDLGDLIAALAVTLATLFVTSLAFANYWFLVAGLSYLSVVAGDRELEAPISRRVDDARSTSTSG